MGDDCSGGRDEYIVRGVTGRRGKNFIFLYLAGLNFMSIINLIDEETFAIQLK